MRKSKHRVRCDVRYEAARIMAEEGVRDYKMAKEKAVRRVGATAGQIVPTNLEIEESLAEHLQIFQRESVSSAHRKYLRTACELMQLLCAYSPFAVGAVLTGNITSSRPIEMHVFCDTIEEVFELLEKNAQRLRIADKQPRFFGGFKNISCLELEYFEVNVEILAFLRADPYPPLSPVDGKPVRKASLKKVTKMLNEASLSMAAAPMG